MSGQPAGADAGRTGHDPRRAATAARRERFVPALSWGRAYQRAWLSRDLAAGFTIWGLLVPEGIAYASLAGLPPQAGLYTLLASLVLYAVFGSSRQLVVAGTSASAVLVYSAITAPRLAGEIANENPNHFGIRVIRRAAFKRLAIPAAG